MSYAEDFDFDGPYDLITAADSLHWMNLDVVIPRVAGALHPNGRLEWPETRQTPRANLATYRQVLEDEEFQSYVSVRYLWLAWTLTELGSVMVETEGTLDAVEGELGAI